MTTIHAPLLRNGRFELVQEVLVRVLDLVDVGLLLLEETGDLGVLVAQRWQDVLRLLDDTCEVRRILGRANRHSRSLLG